MSQNSKLSAIDAAIAAAKARKAAKVNDGDSTPVKSSKASKPTTEKTKKVAEPRAKVRAVKAVDPDKAAAKEAAAEARRQKQEQILQEREARKIAREQERQARAAAKPVRVPAHMKKVERAAAKLPRLNSDAQLAFNELIAGHSAEMLSALALHLQHHNRVAATQRSVTVAEALNIGDSVRIVGGDPRFIGMSGTVDTVRRIRCFVNVPGVNKPVYCFIADVVREDAAAERKAAVG